MVVIDEGLRKMVVMINALLSLTLLSTALTANANGKPEQQQSQDLIPFLMDELLNRPAQVSVWDRPILLSEVRYLPPQLVTPGRQVFSRTVGFVGIVKHVDVSATGEQALQISLRDGTEIIVVSPRFTVSDGGVVIEFLEAEMMVIESVGDRTRTPSTTVR